MAQMSLEELYRGEGAGEKYGIMGEVMKDFLQNGRPSEYDERTWLDMLLVKHALIAAEKMKNEGDTVSGLTDDVSSSSYVRWNENDDLYYGNIVPHEHSFKRGSAYSEVLSYVIRHQDSLIPTLTAQQKETFEKLKDCEAELHGMNEREAFISGFKLAARIMTEVLCKPSED